MGVSMGTADGVEAEGSGGGGRALPSVAAAAAAAAAALVRSYGMRAAGVDAAAAAATTAMTADGSEKEGDGARSSWPPWPGGAAGGGGGGGQKPAVHAVDLDAEALRQLLRLARRAGFQPMTVRDVRLADALNADYLSQLFIKGSTRRVDGALVQDYVDPELPAEARPVLLLQRGYGRELQAGRLLLQKLDYLQTLAVGQAGSWAAGAAAVLAAVLFGTFEEGGGPAGGGGAGGPGSSGSGGASLPFLSEALVTSAGAVADEAAATPTALTAAAAAAVAGSPPVLEEGCGKSGGADSAAGELDEYGLPYGTGPLGGALTEPSHDTQRADESGEVRVDGSRGAPGGPADATASTSESTAGSTTAAALVIAGAAAGLAAGMRGGNPGQQRLGGEGDGSQRDCGLESRFPADRSASTFLLGDAPSGEGRQPVVQIERRTGRRRRPNESDQEASGQPAGVSWLSEERSARQDSAAVAPSPSDGSAAASRSFPARSGSGARSARRAARAGASGRALATALAAPRTTATRLAEASVGPADGSVVPTAAVTAAGAAAAAPARTVEQNARYARYGRLEEGANLLGPTVTVGAVEVVSSASGDEVTGCAGGATAPGGTCSTPRDDLISRSRAEGVGGSDDSGAWGSWIADDRYGSAGCSSSCSSSGSSSLYDAQGGRDPSAGDPGGPRAADFRTVENRPERMTPGGATQSTSPPLSFPPTPASLSAADEASTLAAAAVAARGDMTAEGGWGMASNSETEAEARRGDLSRAADREVYEGTDDMYERTADGCESAEAVPPTLPPPPPGPWATALSSVYSVLSDWGLVPRTDIIPLAAFNTYFPVDERPGRKPLFICKVSLGDALGGADWLRGGLRGLLDGLLREVQLQEPTYREVLVLYRPVHNRMAPSLERARRSGTWRDRLAGGGGGSALDNGGTSNGDALRHETAAAPNGALETEVERDGDAGGDVMSSSSSSSSALAGSSGGGIGGGGGGAPRRRRRVMRGLGSGWLRRLWARLRGLEEDPAVRRPPIQIRMYRDIPIPTWKVVLPEKLLQFRPLDLLRLDLFALAGLAGLAAQARYDNTLVDIITFGSAAVLLVRIVLGYQRMSDRFRSVVNELLAEKALAGQEGAVEALAMAAAQQQLRQAALAYVLLLHHCRPGAVAGAGGGSGSSSGGAGAGAGAQQPPAADAAFAAVLRQQPPVAVGAPPSAGSMAAAATVPADPAMATTAQLQELAEWALAHYSGVRVRFNACEALHELQRLGLVVRVTHGSVESESGSGDDTSDDATSQSPSGAAASAESRSQARDLAAVAASAAATAAAAVTGGSREGAVVSLGDRGRLERGAVDPGGGAVGRGAGCGCASEVRGAEEEEEDEGRAEGQAFSGAGGARPLRTSLPGVNSSRGRGGDDGGGGGGYGLPSLPGVNVAEAARRFLGDHRTFFSAEPTARAAAAAAAPGPALSAPWQSSDAEDDDAGCDVMGGGARSSSSSGSGRHCCEDPWVGCDGSEGCGCADVWWAAVPLRDAVPVVEDHWSGLLWRRVKAILRRRDGL